ncbi:MAG: O-antigen ligase family protein [Deltaproteobacteria bacterium]|nr:O-antigen ligase family protein [Deltaproteobacteria bacterium]
MARLSARIARAFRWCGSGWVILGILAVQLVLAGVFAWDWRIAVVLPVGLAVALVVLERPVAGVALLVAVRLLDTSAHALVQIGHTHIGLFEPILLFALVAVVLHGVRHERRILGAWPWRRPFLGFFAFACLSLTWSADRSAGVSEILSIAVILANAVVILTFVRTPRDVLVVLYAWLAASVGIGLFSFVSGALGVQDPGPWQAAAGGGRETGLGQQPNWFAMHLMFIVLPAFGLARVQPRRLGRWVLLGAGLCVFLAQLGSGSRGGVVAVLVGGLLAAFALPGFRRWFFAFVLLIAVLLGVASWEDVGVSSRAVQRISENLAPTWGAVRGLNWRTCVQMFQDTWGLGIGAGAYVARLPEYSGFLYASVHRYPHGIFWGLLAHYGVVGLVLAGWLVAAVLGMTRRLAAWTRDSSLHVVTWTVAATMAGYAAWSFVEFEYNEKPFWEFLSLYTALYLAVERAVRDGVPLPAPPGRPGALASRGGGKVVPAPGLDGRDPAVPGETEPPLVRDGSDGMEDRTRLLAGHG